MFFFMLRPPPAPTLFPYTTLFRSHPVLLGRSVWPLLDDLAGDVGARDVIAAHPELRAGGDDRSEEHTSELQSRQYLVCRLLREKKKTATIAMRRTWCVTTWRGWAT